MVRPQDVQAADSGPAASSTPSERRAPRKSWEDRPVLRVLHTLARTGGTVIGKCIGVMPGVAMLSEVHPAVNKLLEHPLTQKTPDVVKLLARMEALRQAHQWFNLLTPEDRAALVTRGALPPFEESVDLIHQRASERGLTLVLRDWSHLDFAAAPFIARPTHRLSTAQTLASRFHIVSTTFVRHPIDQWLSIQGIPMLKQRLTLEQYLEGVYKFAIEAERLGFIRYEDFTKDPDPNVKLLCERLKIDFDPTYRERWATYTKITGDTKGTRAQTEIVSLPRRPVDQATLDRFIANEHYRAAIDLLGYPHP